MIRFIRIGKTEWDIESHIGYADKNLRKRFTALVKIINNQSNLLGSLHKKLSGFYYEEKAHYRRPSPLH